MVGLELLLFKNATVFYFVISHGRDRVVRESAVHASIQLCGPCVKKQVSTHFFHTV